MALKNVNLNLKDLLHKAKRNISALLLFALIILVVFEGWVVKGSVAVLSDSGQTTAFVSPKLVRVNFSMYDAIAKRISDSGSYSPQPFVYHNPFGINEKPANASN